jgi:hypothetical protein
MFVTMSSLQLDPVRNRLLVARAGHEPVLVIHENGDVENIAPRGTALGMLEVADFEEMIEFLETVVYPSVRPPEAITGDPEEAEAATQRMVGILEGMTGADLYPARNLGNLAEQLAAMVDVGCAAYAAGEDLVAVESIYAVRNPYRKNLRRLLDLIAPEIHRPAAAHLDALISRNPPADPATSCGELQELLLEARNLL